MNPAHRQACGAHHRKERRASLEENDHHRGRDGSPHTPSAKHGRKSVQKSASLVKREEEHTKHEDAREEVRRQATGRCFSSDSTPLRTSCRTLQRTVAARKSRASQRHADTPLPCRAPRAPPAPPADAAAAAAAERRTWSSSAAASRSATSTGGVSLATACSSPSSSGSPRTARTATSTTSD